MQARILVGLVLVSYALAVAPLYGVGAPDAVEGRYMVIFNEDITEERRNAHLTAHASNILHKYNFNTFKGFSAYLDEDALEKLIESPDVQFIEVVQVMKTSIIKPGKVTELKADACLEQDGATWGLDRIDSRPVDLDGTYAYADSAGKDVDVYVIDTGVHVTHVDFNDRATWGNNFVGDNTNDDCNGHGTHVAGTVAGATYGVAKQANIIAVKVLGCDGSGTNDGVVDGVLWVAQKATSTRRPSVANMSLGGGASSALDRAVQSAIAGGVTFAIAAGNSDTSACSSSPARVTTGITVGATTVDDEARAEEDERAYFSNYGTCVHILAPGQLITSDWFTSNTATKTISGTSMAAPHVAGAAALYLGENRSATPAEVKKALLDASTKNIVKLACVSTSGSCVDTPNRLLYVGNLCSNSTSA